MTPRKKAATGKKASKKLKLNKETLKDLGARSKAGDVKGGVRATIGNDWNCAATKGNDWNCGATVGNCW